MTLQILDFDKIFFSNINNNLNVARCVETSNEHCQIWIKKPNSSIGLLKM